MRLAAVGRSFYWAFLVFCGLFAALLLAARLSGLAPGLFDPSAATWYSFAAIPVLAVLVSVLIHRRPTLPDAARLVDQSTGAKDLYLTLALIDTSAGEYQPLVVRSAESQAPSIHPERVLPFGWHKRFWHAVWVPSLVALGVLFLPQLDPFGKVAKANLIEKRHERLAESRKITELRLDEVRKKIEEHEEYNETDDAIEELKLAFNKMEPTKKNDNLKVLQGEQKDLGKLWRQISAERLKDLMKTSASGDQQFGANKDDEKLEKWQQELQQGDAGGIQKELQDLKQALQKLAQTKDPVERSELMQQLKERMEAIEELASDKIHNEQLANAIERAMQQLQLSEQEDLSKEALESAMQSLELSQAELQDLEQAIKDMKELEQALKTIQQAKKLNDEEKLDGAQAGECKTLADYEELYAKLLAEGGEGESEEEKEGEGMGQRGFGKGGEAPEDDSVETGFKSEQSKSAVVAGKMLMSMQQKGEAEKGEVVRDYKQLVTKVKQGAMEALNTEQIPPGYHDGIKSYFDALEKSKESSKPK
ncbi:hypothetical protein FJZ55_05660 [Candidatus Woesearchaeota archaeon]|nr:hypothetical protein [Candidatus Woesearchaeota archaeon]